MRSLYIPSEEMALAAVGRNRGVSGGGGLEQAGRRARGVWGQSDPAVESSAVGDFLAPDCFEFDTNTSRIIAMAPGHWARGSDPRPSSPIQTPVLRPRHAKRP